jgi:hypothetical protein
MPQHFKSSRQAKRIPESSRPKCLSTSSRSDRPNEYPKVPGPNAAAPQVEREGPTNTSKFQAQMPQHLKSKRQAQRIPQSPRPKCRSTSSRKGRPNEYPKVPGPNAAAPQVEETGQTNTPKPQVQMPQYLKSKRQAKRIPQSPGPKCRSTSSRRGRPNEYPKVPGPNASALQAEREGQTNTSKFQAQMPQHLKSKRQAQRIPQSPRPKCLSTSSRKGRPNEYPKVPGPNAAAPQVASAGQTNTPKFQAQMPQHLKSKRHAKRIPKSSRPKCHSTSSRKGRPNEYFKVPGTYASAHQVASAGQTNTPKPQAQMPQHFKPKGKAKRIPQSPWHICL